MYSCVSNTKALPGIYSCEPVHGSLCATISIQLTRIHRKNTTVSIKIKFFVAFKINFFMITSFSFLETMLKCVCLFLGMVSMFLSHFGAVTSEWAFLVSKFFFVVLFLSRLFKFLFFSLFR